MLKLKKPLVVFDLETTGLDTKTDRIIQIALTRLFPDGRKPHSVSWLVFPEIHIPSEVTELTGITDLMVTGKPTFADIADDVVMLMGGADLAGHNIESFDVPMLKSELARCHRALNWADVQFLDTKKIFVEKEKRDLESALKFYCDEDFAEGTRHTAGGDVDATTKVIMGMARRYFDGIDNGRVVTVEDMIQLGLDKSGKFVDPDRKFIWRNGEPAFCFGKHRGRALREVATTDSGYLYWLINKADEFSDEGKRIVQDALGGKHRQRPAPAAVPA